MMTEPSGPERVSDEALAVIGEFRSDTIRMATTILELRAELAEAHKDIAAMKLAVTEALAAVNAEDDMLAEYQRVRAELEVARKAQREDSSIAWDRARQADALLNEWLAQEMDEHDEIHQWLDDFTAKVKAHLAGATPQREGWVAVPMEPTNKMIEVGAMEAVGDSFRIHDERQVERIWSEMLAAAPRAQGEVA